MSTLTDDLDRRLMLEHTSAQDYQAANLQNKRYLVHEPGGRGFFAEFSTVAHAMVYAWTNNLQFVLDSSRWSFGIEQGWADYFIPIFPEYQSAMDDRVEFRTSERVHPSVEGRHIHYHNVLFSRPARVAIGDHIVLGDHPINIHFLRMLFRYNGKIRRAIEAQINALELPDHYVALHLRRGDKVGDEDILYPTQAYLDHVSEAYRNLPVFAMSDDHAAINDVREALAGDGSGRALFSLTEKNQAGFNEQRLQRGAFFLQADSSPTSDTERSTYTNNEVIRLLAETVIAAQSQCFVGTYFSNVGKVIRDLHQLPNRVTLMQPHQLERKPQ
ncbi:MAG: hypothetical protein HOC23_07465 [Halieaceae bacterium]|jgi:hypothetical protein|nr:hypothetical protein [Halieaceae bacterium]